MSASRGDPARWATGYDFPAKKEGKITLEKDRAGLAGTRFGLCVQYQAQAFRGCARARGAGHGLRFRMGQCQSVLGRLSSAPMAITRARSFPRKAFTASDKPRRRSSAMRLPHFMPAFMDGSYALPVTRRLGPRPQGAAESGGPPGRAGWKVADAGLVNDGGRGFCLHHYDPEQGPGEDRAQLSAHVAADRHQGAGAACRSGAVRGDPERL